MPSPPFSTIFSPSGGRRAESSGDAQERLIPFPVPARSNGELEAAPRRRRRDLRDLERPTPQKRARRRRQSSTPWLQRNALSIAAVSILAALLGLGFGLLQTITRPDANPALLAIGNQADPTSIVASNAALVGSSPVQMTATTGPGAPIVEAPREIRASAKIIEPTYEVKAGDTLGQIAASKGTTVERLQAFNNLPDPRALRIGSQLVIPPPL